EERKSFSQAELDQTLAPVALYPDALLSQVLMAATYPLEIVEAARWSRAHPGIQGDEAVSAVQDKDWDPSVKSLVAFPNLLARMDENLEWTRRLGDAFLAQEAQVMDTIQQLRQRAKAEGKLESDERQRVTADGQTIVIEQANPQVVYVPYYDPYVVYGSWWWPAYPPVYWAPWPGYYAVGSPGFWWGIGVGISTGFFYGGMSWHHHHVAVVHPHAYYTKPGYVRPYGPPPRQVQAGKWQHDNWHRRGVGQSYETRRTNAMPPAGFRATSDHRGATSHGDQRADPRRIDDRRTALRPEHRAESPRPQSPGDAQRQQPRFESPRAQPRSESPRAAPQANAPRGQIRMEGPRPQSPRAQAPNAQPRMEAPRPQPRVQATPQQARVQAPSAQPRFEAPRSQPHAGAPQSMPRMESRGGESRGWGGSGAARGWSGGGEFRGGGSYGGRGGSGGGGGYGGGQGGGRGRG
ncbi:MAG TPA: DUF3300 domain-containing protein, partial [Burkholderiales bacterium]